MAKRKIQQGLEISAINSKLDVILAILLRQLSDDGLEKWNKQDKPNIVRMLISISVMVIELSSFL